MGNCQANGAGEDVNEGNGNGHASNPSEEFGRPSRSRGPQTPEGKAKALANLRPPWTTEEAVEWGRKNPHRNPGATMKTWMAVMSDWSRIDLKVVMDDDNNPSTKIAAARTLYDMGSQERTSSGAPIAGPEFDRVMDYTIGKPKQSVDVSMDATVKHKEETQEAMKRLFEDTESLGALETIGKRLANETDPQSNQ